MKYADLEIYFNNKYIKKIRLGNMVGYYDVKLYNFCKDYVAVEVTNSNAYFDKGTIIIIDTQGNIIGDTLQRSNVEGYHIKSTNESGWYEINNENIIIFEPNENNLEKVKYTVKNSKLVKEVIATYDWSDVEVSGK